MPAQKTQKALEDSRSQLITEEEPVMSRCLTAMNHERSEPEYLASSEHVDRYDKWWGLGTWENCQEKKFQGAVGLSLEVNCLGEKYKEPEFIDHSLLVFALADSS